MARKKLSRRFDLSACQKKDDLGRGWILKRPSGNPVAMLVPEGRLLVPLCAPGWVVEETVRSSGAMFSAFEFLVAAAGGLLENNDFKRCKPRDAAHGRPLMRGQRD